MKFSRNYLSEFIFNQKCIPWKLRMLIRRISAEIKIFFGRLYDREFFDAPYRQQLKDRCALPIANTLLEKYNPKSVIDIGCGDGMYIEEMSKKGIYTMGYDNSIEAIKRCRKKDLNVKRFNILRNKFILRRRFDLAICFEVAEHLPDAASIKLVNALCKVSKTIIFTAAPPGQGGFHHINERPYIYWITKFNKMSYYLDTNDTEFLKKEWQINNVIPYMIRNLMIFKRIAI